MRQEGLTNEVKNLRQNLDEQESYKKKFKDDVFECLHHITDFKKLKAGVIRLHKKYVKEEVKNEAGDTDLHREYANKRRYLENNVNYLRLMLQKDQDVHKKENSKIMSENVYLLQEINDQRKECHALNQKIKQNIMKIEELSMGGRLDGMYGTEAERELKELDMEIDDLTRQFNEYEQQNEIMRQQRPHIGQLPPMEGDYQEQYDNMPDMDDNMPEQQVEQPVQEEEPEQQPAQEGQPPEEQKAAEETAEKPQE
jgi:paraquat-inducible protein B